MKILALTILFILMFFRIKDTPSALSKTLWRKKMIKQLAKSKENNNGKPLSDAMQGGCNTDYILYGSILNYLLHSIRKQNWNN